MKYDAYTDVKPDADIKTDICIIGSGAAGIVMAHKLIGSGRDVVVLESSRVNVPQPFSDERLRAFQESEFPAVGEQPHRYEDPTVQPLYEGTMSEGSPDADDFLKQSRVRCYGGTTNCWGGWTHPLVEQDFDRRDLNPNWSWPITREDLGPFYTEAISRYCSLGNWTALAYDDPKYWVGKTTPAVAPLELTPNSPLRSTVFTVMYGGDQLKDADRYLNFQSVWGPAIESSTNVSLYCNANVRLLDSTELKGLVTRVRATTVNDAKTAGHSFTVTARLYVLATGAIETARLLLHSGGLGNPLDQVGRNLLVHPLSEHAATFAPGKEPPPAVRTFYSGVAPISGRQYPPTVFAALIPAATTLTQQRIGNFRAKIDFNGWVNLNWEQLPNPRNRVTLDQSRDPLFGDPRVKCALELHQADRETFAKALNLIQGELEALGYAKKGTFKPTNESVYLPGAHAMGTARMASDTLDGVVNANCRVHSVRNLYVAGTAVFPTGGFANPTLTIIALALRLAEHLRKLG
jgi:choline dehydrogenase-like flavoprotein